MIPVPCGRHRRPRPCEPVDRPPAERLSWCRWISGCSPTPRRLSCAPRQPHTRSADDASLGITAVVHADGGPDLGWKRWDYVLWTSCPTGITTGCSLISPDSWFSQGADSEVLLSKPSFPFLRDPVPRSMDKHPPEGLIYRLAFHCVTDVPKDHKHNDRQEHDHPEGDPICPRRIHALQVLDLRREIGGHQAHRQEQDGDLGQQDRDPRELLHGLRVFEGDEVEVLHVGLVSAAAPKRSIED